MPRENPFDQRLRAKTHLKIKIQMHHFVHYQLGRQGLPWRFSLTEGLLLQSPQTFVEMLK
ncbi:MAG: hypothetical protein EBZ77_18150 [Chitinophagia bacterium]|nr:hypothetical protein [Chitinophagia bacterium]